MVEGLSLLVDQSSYCRRDSRWNAVQICLRWEDGQTERLLSLYPLVDMILNIYRP